MKGCLAVGVCNEKPTEGESEAVPMIFSHHVTVIGRSLQTPHGAVLDIAEILQDTPEFGAEPEGARLPVYLFKDKDSSAKIPMESRFFNDSHQGVFAAVSIHVTRTEPVDRVGQRKTIEVVQRVVLLGEHEGRGLVTRTGCLATRTGCLATRTGCLAACVFRDERKAAA